MATSFESNDMRRAHRVNIPIIIVIDSVPYHTKDWSMTGAGIENVHREFHENETVDALIVLALKEARIEFPVTLEFKAKRNNVYGFEFLNLSQKNKRVLREFLELAIEGRLDQVDTLLGVYNEPVVDSPITETVVFSDEEESLLKRKFLKRSKLYIRLGIIFFILLILTVIYNTMYVYRSIGTVSGNFIKVTPSVSGKVSKVYVQVKDIVHPKTLLLELDNTMALNQIEIIDKKLANLKKRYQTGHNYKDKELLYVLRENMNKKYKAYLSAVKLYKNRLIANADLQRSFDAYSLAKIRYLQEKNRFAGEEGLAKGEGSIVSLQTELELKREALLNKLNYMRIYSETEGNIYAIKAHAGNYVGSSDVVMIIETQEPSFVVCKLKQDEAVTIRRDMKVKVYSPSKDKTYRAHVEAIGNLSLNPESLITNEVSLKEVSIKVVFEDKNLKLPLNERVKLWFYRSLY